MATVEPDSVPTGTWLELSVEADSESVEAVAELLSRYAYGQGVAVYEQFQQDPDGDNLSPDPTRPVRVVAYLPSADSAADTVQKIETGLWHLRQIGPVGELAVQERPEEDWANSWKEHFHTLRIGRRFVIRPTWREYSPEAGDLVIDLDPGMAFGTGHHPTTELCLRWMEDLKVEGLRVLDVGAGSGILTIAAKLLGAVSIDAVEVDDVAARALRENLEMNGANDRARVFVGDFGSFDTLERGYDLVIANIISSVLLKLSEPLTRAVSPDGKLLLSGVIDRHLDLVRSTFQGLGFRVLEDRQIGDWYALLLEHDE